MNSIVPSADLPETAAVSGRVLVVDDIATTRALHRSLLAPHFDVFTASSGAEALEFCRQQLPDLILLDIEMPEMTGIATCQHLREWTDVPIIFATGHECLEAHMRAYDAGGNDLVVKPVQSAILLRKAALAIRQYRAGAQLAEEKSSLQTMAMNFLSTAGQNGALLNFMRASMVCRSHRKLAETLQNTIAEMGIRSSVLLRHPNGTTFVPSTPGARVIEQAILEQSATMGRLFQFKQRLVVNYDHVSILVANMPDETAEPENAGRIRDNIAILAETAEALCDNVNMRIESIRRAEQLQVALGGAEVAVELLRAKYHHMLGDTRLLLQDLAEKVQRRYNWLGATQNEEAEIVAELDASIQAILGLLAEGGNFERQFEDVLAGMKGGDTDNREELF